MTFWRDLRPRVWRHASDEALLLLATAGASQCDPRLATHVAVCGNCHARLTYLLRALADARREAAAQANQIFPPARLERQRASILRRIGGSKAAARILPFPGLVAVAPGARPQFWKRSVAAAAVAGLVLGAAAGRVLLPPSGGRLLTQQNDAPLEHAPSRVPGPELVRASWSADELFLEDFEAAVGGTRVEPLLALDALTPDLPGDIGGR